MPLLRIDPEVGRSLFWMFGPTILNPVTRFAAVLTLDRTPESWVGLPADPAVNFLPLILLLNIAMSDTAEECSKRFKRQNINSQRQLHTGLIIGACCNFCTRRVKILLKKRKSGGKKMFPHHIFVPRGLHLLASRGNNLNSVE